MESAKIKPVRPFNPSLCGQKDLLFQQWKLSQKSLSIEIGCGAGLHPIQWAQNHLNSGLIALERTQNKFKAFKSRISHHERPNLYGVNADAHDWLPTNIEEKSIESYFLLYPNPYPKESQANKRWFRSPIFHYILKTIKPKGKIHFATNELFLYEETLLYAKNLWNLQIESSRQSHQTSWPPRTHFEKKYLTRGQNCFDVTFITQ